MNSTSPPLHEVKNTRTGSQRLLFELADQSLAVAENTEETFLSIDSMVRKTIIHFYFCLDGSALFEFPLYL